MKTYVVHGVQCSHPEMLQKKFGLHLHLVFWLRVQFLSTSSPRKPVCRPLILAAREQGLPEVLRSPASISTLFAMRGAFTCQIRDPSRVLSRQTVQQPTQPHFCLKSSPVPLEPGCLGHGWWTSSLSLSRKPIRNAEYQWHLVEASDIGWDHDLRALESSPALAFLLSGEYLFFLPLHSPNSCLLSLSNK